METSKKSRLKYLLMNSAKKGTTIRERIRTECYINEKTLERWMNDPGTVPALSRYIIADILNVQVEELFP